VTAIKSLNAMYDRDSDVLYVSSRSAAAARGVEAPDGIVWRYDHEGDLIGVTIVNFNDHWSDKRPELVREMSAKFDIPSGQTEQALDHALSE